MRIFESTGTARLCFLIAAAALSLAACPDPEGEFNAFDERYESIQDEGGGGGGEGGAPACTPQAPGEADGKYLFALSAVLDPPKAFALDAEVVTTDAGDGALSLTLTLTPLSRDDQTTPVGEPITFEDLPVNADGTFEWDFGAVTLPEEANPVSMGNYVEAELVLIGSLCGGEGANFICGDVLGTVLHPIPDFPLEDSTFTMQRYEGELPDPVINCAKEPAVY